MGKIFIKVLKKTGILQFINFQKTIKINDKKFVIPIIGGTGFSNYVKMSEIWMIQILDILINKMGFNTSFLDVGVNLGQTLLKLKSVSSSVDYFGFEPNPFCINYVQKLITVNNFKNVELFPVGIGDTTSVQKINFYSNSDIGKSASLLTDFRKHESVIKQFNVPVFNPTLIEEINNIDIVKIDVEGAEFEVLKGLNDLIKLNKPVMLLEVLPNYNGKIKERVIRQDLVLSILEEFGYMIFRIKITDGKFKGIEKVSDFGTHSDLSLTDYILFEESKSKLVSDFF